MTRREALRRLAAGSALGMFPGLVSAAFRGQQRQSVETPFQRVNVLFHGLSVAEFGSGEVHVYLPTAGSGRAYLAGTWMQEMVLGQGKKYRLSGVMTGPRPVLRSIDPERNAVFRRRPIKRDESFCTLVFPFPDFVTALRPLHKRHGENFFTGSPRPIVEPKSIPQVTAFSYVRPDYTTPLEFLPANWTPVVEDGIVNLHVWDATAKPPLPQASLQAFARMAKMIDAPRLGINPVYDKIKLPRPDKDPAVEGMNCQEEWTLAERTGDPEGCGKHSRYHPKDDSALDCLSVILY